MHSRLRHSRQVSEALVEDAGNRTVDKSHIREYAYINTNYYEVYLYLLSQDFGQEQLCRFY